MRVLHIINSLNTGGAEKLLVDALPIFINYGIVVDLLVLDGGDYPFMEVAKKSYKQINIYSLGKGSVYSPFLIFKILPYLRKYDIVHAHLFPTQYFVVLSKLLSLSKVRLIFTEHNTTNRRMNSKLFSLLDSFVYKRYNKVICISQEVRDALLSHLDEPTHKFPVINNGIDLNKIYKAKPLDKNAIHPSISDTDTLIIQVAGFRKQKDQVTVIRALKKLPNHVKLILVGEGTLKKECEAMVQVLGLKDRVIFLGIRMDVPQLLKTADIAVISSHWEGFGLAAVESMAAGKPLIASANPGLLNVVKGGGLLFTPGDEFELASILNRILENKDEYNGVSVACSNKASLYDIKIMVANYAKVYEGI